MRRVVAEAVIAVLYFQIVLTPIAAWVWLMTWEQYAAWTITNCILSPFLGIGYSRLHARVFG